MSSCPTGPHQTAIVASPTGSLALSHTAPIPQPGPGEMLVAVAAVSLNPFDAKMRGPDLATPGAIAGADLAGTVVSVTPEAERAGWAVGDRVCAFVTGMHRLTPDVGAFSQFVVVQAHSALSVPEGMGMEEAAALGVVVGTVGLALFRALRIPDVVLDVGEKGVGGDEQQPAILIYGASSAIGTFAVQIAKL